jgi:hypothetical protein
MVALLTVSGMRFVGHVDGRYLEKVSADEVENVGVF